MGKTVVLLDRGVYIFLAEEAEKELLDVFGLGSILRELYAVLAAAFLTLPAVNRFHKNYSRLFLFFEKFTAMSYG